MPYPKKPHSSAKNAQILGQTYSIYKIYGLLEGGLLIMILKMLKKGSVIKLLLLWLSELRLAFAHPQLQSAFTVSLRSQNISEEKHMQAGRLCPGDAQIFMIVSMKNKSRYLSRDSSRKGNQILQADRCFQRLGPLNLTRSFTNRS